MIDRGTIRQVFGLGLIVLLTSGCYRYVPVDAPQRGMDVRASLTLAGAVRQSELMGQPIRHLSGRLVDYGNDDVRLDVITASSRGSFQNIVLRDTLSIPRADVTSLERREISWVRTGLVFGAVAAAAVAGIASVTSGGGDVDPDGPPPPTQDRISIPIFSIPR